MNINRTTLLKQYNIQKTEELDQLIEELKQNISAKIQRLSRYRKRQNQYYQNKLFRTDCKKMCNRGELLERNIREKTTTQWRGGLDKKPVPTKSKHGMEPSMCKRRCIGTKKNDKLESSWKRQNTKF